MNNAADHSGGTSVTVSLAPDASHVRLLVSDDGIGVFDRICTAFSLEDRAAILDWQGPADQRPGGPHRPRPVLLQPVG